MQQVAAGRVHVNAVEAGLLGPHRRGRELLHQTLDLGDGEFLGHLIVEVGRVRHRDGGGAQRRARVDLVGLYVV